MKHFDEQVVLAYGADKKHMFLTWWIVQIKMRKRLSSKFTIFTIFGFLLVLPYTHIPAIKIERKAIMIPSKESYDSLYH